MQEIDVDYMQRKRSSFPMKQFLDNMFEEVKINTPFTNSNKTRVYVPNHKSLLDFVFLAEYFLKQNNPLHIIGGSNLLVPGLTSQPSGLIDLEKCGMIPMPRYFIEQPKEAMKFKKDLDQLLKSGKDFVVYAGGGRDYEGEINELKDGILKKVFNRQEIEVIPITLSYEKVAEAELFPSHKGLKKITEYAGTIIMLRDLWEFGIHYFSENKGNLYIDFGKPELVSDHPNCKSLCEKLQQTMAENVRITSTSIVAEGMTEYPNSIEELYDIVEKKLESLNGKPLADNIEKMTSQEITDRGLKFLAATKNTEGRLSVKEHLMSYYANHIQHHFMSPRTS